MNISIDPERKTKGMRYSDLVLLVREPLIVKAEGKKSLTFKLLVPENSDASLPCELDLRKIAELKDNATLSDATWEDARLLGEALSSALFPPEVSNLIDRRIIKAKAEEEGLRIRLLLSGSDLSNLPWEFLLLNRGGGENKISDFMGLMPNVSLVRHTATSLPAWKLEAQLPVKVYLAAASPDGWPKLKVAEELSVIKQALEDNAQVLVSSSEHTQRSGLPNKAKPAHVFHFAGHGQFERVQSRVPGAYEGKSSVLLEDEYGEPDVLDAELLAVQLCDAGVRVAVLGACQTAQRDDVNAWSSVAEALLKAELGAVVGMQFPVADDSALCFAKNFYAALAIGLSVDESVAAGRVAVANLDDPRGWANPTLYLRVPDGVIFPAIAANTTLEAARQEATAKVKVTQRIKDLYGKATALKGIVGPGGVAEATQGIDNVKKGAEAIGFEGKVGGKLEVNQEIDEVEGEVIGGEIDLG
jgi:hypothetical protein